MNKETPCIAVCMIDPKIGRCFGRGRTPPRIARWHGMGGAGLRAVIMAELPQRMADAGLSTIATNPECIAALLEASNHEASADFVVPAGRGRHRCSQASGAARMSPRRGVGFLAR